MQQLVTNKFGVNIYGTECGVHRVHLLIANILKCVSFITSFIITPRLQPIIYRNTKHSDNILLNRVLLFTMVYRENFAGSCKIIYTFSI